MQPPTQGPSSPAPFGVLRAKQRDQLYLFRQGFLYTSPWVVTPRTQRYSAVLLLDALGRGFDFESDGLAGHLQAAAVAPGVARGLGARDIALLSVHVEPAHPAYPAFAALRAGGGACALARARFDPWNEAMLAAWHGTLSLPRAQVLFDALVDTTRASLPDMAARDPRTALVLDALNAHPDSSLSQLADGIGLSYDRMSHLFSQEVGLPLRSYQLWRKVKQVAWWLNSGRSLTELALAAGFSDSAHLSHTFQHFFGIRPSYLVDSDCVQVHM